MTNEKTREAFAKGFTEKIKNMVQFPARIKFTLYRSTEEAKQSIVVSEMKRSLKKKKIENVRFEECQSFILGGHAATIDIGDYNDAEQVMAKVLKLSEIWEGTVIQTEECEADG